MGEGKSMQREEEDKTTMPDLEKETMEKGGRGVDLRSGKRNDVEGETVSRDGGTNKEEMKWLSSKSQSLEKKSLAGDGKASGYKKILVYMYWSPRKIFRDS